MNGSQPTTDFLVYTGQINMAGYEMLCNVLKHKKSEKVVLVLGTPGGDPHAAFRIARAVQHTYDTFDALIPRYCKSAGTLVLIGAKRLYLDDMSELGPLDVQIKKGDELVGNSSGLDIFQAVNYLQGQAMVAFQNYLVQLNRDMGLSTKLASEISTRLTIGMLEPISGQIDPMKLAEMQRATEIAFAYGNRLNENSKNLRTGGLASLVTGYPSHGFVIDRKEAKTLFTDVKRPDGVLWQLSEALRAEMQADLGAEIPKLKIFQAPFLLEGETDAATPPNARPSSGSDPGSEPAIHGSREADPTQTTPISSASASAPGAVRRTRAHPPNGGG